MDQTQTAAKIEEFIAAVEKLLPGFLANPADKAIADGNVALLIIDETGHMWGRLLGTDRHRQRGSSKIAWQKATQVWLTNIATGRFEELVYSRQLDPGPFGIMNPDFIGWFGGLPATLADGTKLALAFSGMRGENDAEIMRQAAAQVGGITIA
jgi:glc operon protein GlcG